METMTMKEFFALRARRREFNTVDLKQLREERRQRKQHERYLEIFG
jgi:hypothetical protein